MSPILVLAACSLLVAPVLCQDKIDVGRTYKFFNTRVPQPTAAQKCQSSGGKLADLGTNCRLDELRDAIPGTAIDALPINNEMWIAGSTDQLTNGVLLDVEEFAEGNNCRILSNYNIGGEKFNVYSKVCSESRFFLCEY